MISLLIGPRQSSIPTDGRECTARVGLNWSTHCLKNPFCVPIDELLWAKDDLLSEEGQTLSSLTEQIDKL